MPTAGQILDYASPRQRGKLRLPSQSVLEVRQDEGGGVTVTETLSGRGGAVGAIVFAVITLLLLAATGASQLKQSRGFEGEAFVLFVIGAVWIAELTVLLVVINNTWRRTVLTVGADGVALQFLAPFSKRRYAWPRERMEDVRVVRTSESSPLRTWEAPQPLGELLLLPVGERAVALLTDHREGELHAIAQSVRATLA